jgi:preprotein translocase subunit YajC
MVEALAKGDEVVMASGMLGKISKLGDTYLSVEITAGVDVQIQRSAVIQVLPKGTVSK